MLVTVKQQIVTLSKFDLSVPFGVSAEEWAKQLIKNDPRCNHEEPVTPIQYLPDSEEVISTTIEDEDGNVLGKWVANTGK